MSVMRKALQKSTLKRMIEARNVDADLFDLESSADSKSHLDENFHEMEWKINAQRKHDEDFWLEKAEEMYAGQDVQKILFWKWMRWKWRHPQSNTTLEQFMFGRFATTG